MEAKKKSWTSALFAYAGGEKKRLALSVVLSVLSVMLGLVPFYCMYALICLFVAGTATAALAVRWCLLALLAYAVKILLFSLSTGTSHAMAYTILEGLRLRLADRFLHAPLGNVENHTIGEIKSMMVDKIENLEPPLAHMIPEGAGHVVLPVVSIIALLCLDWRLAPASLVTFPLSFLCMGLTFKISGKNFEKYDQSANYMNSTIVEYIEGIEVIKAFGRAGVSYEKYATAFTDPENEDKIQRSIAALTRGKTLLVIAHRLSTIKNADNIVVLKNGAIVAQGTQEQLLEKCPLYQDMWRSHIGAKNWAVSTAAKEA